MANKLRSILTMLIIAFGIMALVGILTALDSLIFSFGNSFASLGANSFKVQPIRSRGRHQGRISKRGKAITFDEARRFSERYNFPSDVSISMYCGRSSTAKYKNEKTNPTIPVIATDINELKIYKNEIKLGRYFSKAEVNSGADIAVIGEGIVRKLFKKKDKIALNKLINIDNRNYRVVGILKSQGSSKSSGDSKILIPLMTGKKRYSANNTSYDISVKIHDAIDMEKAEGEAIVLLRKLRNLRTKEENDFEIVKSDAMLERLKEDTSTIRWAAIIISIITLVGAAIGLMNIMLVSVTERTKEIGVLKAIGASRKNILYQFLTEAILICEIGGLIGIIFGLLIGFIVANSVGSGSFQMPWMWIGIAIASTTFTGVISGLYPSMKAASFNPVDALRYE